MSWKLPLSLFLILVLLLTAAFHTLFQHLLPPPP